VRFPDQLFTRSLLWRGLLIWAGTRLLVALGGAGVAGTHPASLDVPGTLLLVTIVGFLGILEARRRNEHILLANFGTSQALLVSLCAAPAVLAELLIGVAGRG
jgi:hypothetical protein